MGVIRATTRSSETGRSQCPMRPRISAAWGNPAEISGLPCGNSGVTPWKIRRYPKLQLSPKFLVSTHLAEVTCWFCVPIAPEWRISFKGFRKHEPVSADRSSGMRRTAQKRVIT